MKHVAYRVIYGVCIDKVSQHVTDPQGQDVSEQARDQTTKKKQIDFWSQHISYEDKNQHTGYERHLQDNRQSTCHLWTITRQSENTTNLAGHHTQQSAN